jgi:plastocyanin
MQRRPFFGWLALASLGAGAQPAPPPLHEVAIRDMQFQPADLAVRVGDTVRWVNHEKRTSHSVLFDDVAESERLMPGDAWERRFDAPGRYPYRCGPHPEMTGLVRVG